MQHTILAYILGYGHGFPSDEFRAFQLSREPRVLVGFAYTITDLAFYIGAFVRGKTALALTDERQRTFALTFRLS